MFHVSFIDGRWITKDADGCTVGIDRTQQAAIEAGKKRAVRDRTTISWEDRDGDLQGRTDYS